MKLIFKHNSLQNIFVMVIGYFGLMFVRQSIYFWEDEAFFSAALRGGWAYCLFAVLLGFPPFSKLIK